MKLKPLGRFEMYVIVSKGDIESWRMYKGSPEVFNQHTIMAIFEPVNDTELVMAAWSHGGFNFVSRNEIFIFNTETLALDAAYS